MRNLLIASVVLLLAATPAMAEVITPSDDARIRRSDPTTNYGTAAITVMNAYGGTSDKTYKWYMRFDLSSLTADVDTATLHLNQDAFSGSEDAVMIDVYGLNDGTTGETTWLNGTLTWNNAPSNVLDSNTDFNNATSLGSFNTTDTGGWYSFSSVALTTFMNADANDEITLMFSTATLGTLSNFNSMGYGTSEENPYLDVILIPEPGTIVLLGIGCLLVGLGLVRNRKNRLKK